MYFGMPTSTDAANVPKGMTWQQHQLSQQSAQRMRNLQQFGDPTKLQRERDYQSKLNQWISPSPAPTPPKSTGVPTPEYIKKMREYEGQMSQRRQTQRLFDPLSNELAMGQVPGYELSPQRQREIERMKQARNYEEAQRFQRFEQLRIEEQLARQAQGISARNRQELSPSKINYQLESLKNQNESIRAELEKGPPEIPIEQQQEVIQRAKENAQRFVDSQMNQSGISQQIQEAEERIKQAYAARNMYGTDAMNAEMAKVRDLIEAPYRDAYKRAYSQRLEYETNRLTELLGGNLNWTQRKSQLERQLAENRRQIEEFLKQRTQSQQMLGQYNYANIYKDLQRSLPARTNYAGINPYMQGVI